MPKGAGTITFTTNVDSRNWVIMEIRDSGCGMMPEVLKRATEPFFTTKSGRSGVGLTAAHGIWRRHRGALAIESQPGEGTMIRLAVEAPAPRFPPTHLLRDMTLRPYRSRTSSVRRTEGPGAALADPGISPGVSPKS